VNRPQAHSSKQSLQGTTKKFSPLDRPKARFQLAEDWDTSSYFDALAPCSINLFPKNRDRSDSSAHMIGIQQIARHYCSPMSRRTTALACLSASSRVLLISSHSSESFNSAVSASISRNHLSASVASSAGSALTGSTWSS